MLARQFRIAAGALACAVAVAGCHGGDKDAYPTWTLEPRSYTPREGSSNAYDTYALAAQDVEQKAPDLVKRVSFFPGHRAEAEKLIGATVDKVMRATHETCTFEFVPHKPFEPVPYQRGWRMIGRVFLWRVEDGCRSGNFDKAIANAEAGTKFGFGLTGGSAIDASLGLAVADDIRRALAPYLAKMSAVQLDRLGKGFKTVLAEKPAISTAIRHEQDSALLMIQFLQDSVKTGDLKKVQEKLGPEVNETVRYLDGVASNETKRKAFFEGLAKSAAEEIGLVEQQSMEPASTRKIEHKKSSDAWKSLTKHVAGTARPLLDLNDATVARTRLLILYAEVFRINKNGKPFPRSLAAFSPELTIDPYSGAPLIYSADTAQFSIYSVGSNGQDDGGDTDATFTKPDLKLEIGD